MSGKPGIAQCVPRLCPQTEGIGGAVDGASGAIKIIGNIIVIIMGFI